VKGLTKPLRLTYSNYESSVTDLRNVHLKLIAELAKNSRRSDRELAKTLGISQPTATRARTKLEKTGVIQEYTVIPDLRKIGYKLLVFTFMSFTEDRPELFSKAREWVKSQPSVIFANNGIGEGMNSVMISLHKEYSSYSRLLAQLKQDWQPNLVKEQSFVISLDKSDLTIKPLSLRNLLLNETHAKTTETVSASALRVRRATEQKREAQISPHQKPQIT
jgi:DNA-binding Lrp family transcriptional regulator